MSTTLYFDGLCEPVNPGGYCCYGYIIYDSNVEIAKGYGFTGKGTNNIAEYTALIEALKKAKELGIQSLTIRGDSLLVINQLSGEWTVRSPNIFPLFKEARTLIREFKSILLEWVPREKNEKADSLSRLAYQEVIEKHNKKRKGA